MAAKSASSCSSANIRRECTVCRADVKSLPSSPPTKRCSHPPQICHTCLQEIIRVAVDAGHVGDGIACPNEGCTQMMEYSDVETWASKTVFRAYDTLLLKLQLGQDEEFIRCLSPTCTAGQFHSGADDTPLITCYSCGTKQCHQCKVAWHEEFTCSQWNEELLLRNNQKTDETILTTTKGCPGPGCGRRIEKIDGCDHLVCRRPAGCGFEFCWLCLAPYDPIRQYDNSRHYDHCKYYSGRKGAHPAPGRVQDDVPPIADPHIPEDPDYASDEDEEEEEEEDEEEDEDEDENHLPGIFLEQVEEEDDESEHDNDEHHEEEDEIVNEDEEDENNWEDEESD